MVGFISPQIRDNYVYETPSIFRQKYYTIVHTNNKSLRETPAL